MKTWIFSKIVTSRINPFYILVFIGFMLCGCAKELQSLLDEVLASSDTRIKAVLNNVDKYEVQIQLSTINRPGDSVSFTDYSFNTNDSVYFYPASSVKFPISVLALEKLQQNNSIGIDTPFRVEGDSIKSTFRKDITDIFAVSSNDTYNRLFEYLGKDYINSRLKELQLVPSRISHRLSISDAYNLTSKSLLFYKNDSILYKTDSISNSAIRSLELNRIQKGRGYIKNDSLVNKPMDFSKKNYLPVSTLHGLMKRVIFPEYYPEHLRFKLSNASRTFLLNAMSILPKEVGYNTEEYFDGYGKFFMYGDTKDTIPEHLKIYNKVGYAYGYLTDCAYIKDSKHDLEYIVTATIHVNDNGIFNDDTYEYDSIGLPFLAQFGRELHQLLIERNSNN